MAFKSFDYECTWWRLFQKQKFDIYFFKITDNFSPFGSFKKKVLGQGSLSIVSQWKSRKYYEDCAWERSKNTETNCRHSWLCQSIHYKNFANSISFTPVSANNYNRHIRSKISYLSYRLICMYLT